MLGLATLSVFIVAPSSTQAVTEGEPRLEDSAPRSVVLRGDLARVGLTPDALAASGIGPDLVSSMIGVLAQESDFGLDRLRGAASRHDDAVEELSALERAIRAGLADEAQLTNARGTREAASFARSSHKAAEAALLDAVGLLLEPLQREALRMILANRDRGVPLPYAATDLSPAERVTLRDALSIERFASERDLALDDETASFLRSLRERAEVIAASDGLSRIEEIRFAYDGALFMLDR